MLCMLAALSTGCGSSGSPAASSANFAQRAQRICVADLEGQVAALKNSGGNLQTILNGMQSSSASVIARLAALTPPPGQRAAYVRFLGDVRAIASASNNPDYVAVEAQAHAHQSRAATDARAAGLNVCAQVYGGSAGAAASKPAPQQQGGHQPRDPHSPAPIGDLGPALHSPDAILHRVIGAVSDVHSYQVTGNQQTDKGHEALSVEVVPPDRLAGTVLLNGLTVRLVMIGRSSYMRAPAGFWARLPRATPAAVAVLAKRWVMIPTASNPSLARRSSELANLATNAARCGEGKLSALRYGGHTVIDGQPVVIIRDTGTAPGSAHGTVYVSMRAPVLPIREVVTGPQRPGAPPICRSNITSGVFNVSHVNRSFSIRAPRSPLVL